MKRSTIYLLTTILFEILLIVIFIKRLISPLSEKEANTGILWIPIPVAAIISLVLGFLAGQYIHFEKMIPFFSFSHRSLYLLCYFCNKCHFRLWLFPFALLRSPQWYMGSPFHVYILSKRPYLVHRLCIWSGSLSLKKRLLIGHLYFLMYLCQKFPR